VGSEYEGAAYVFSGATGARLWRFPSESGGQYSRAVAGLPDADGDARADIAVGAPFERLDLDAPLGVLYIFSGTTAQLLHRLPFRCAALAGLPDLAWPYDLGGYVHVVSGATGQAIRTLARPPLATAFGYAVAGVPDLNGDGVVDLIVGAIGENQQRGAVYIFSGASGLALRRLSSPRPVRYGDFGSSVAAVPDANGDGRAEIVVGAVGEQDEPPVAQTGRAYLFLSCPADLNADGLATSQDFFDFLTAYFTPEGGRADFNRDGAVNSQDFFDFLAAFFAGCE
jgi:hypothetical protein